MEIIKGVEDTVAELKQKGYFDDNFARDLEDGLNAYIGGLESYGAYRTKSNSKNLLKMNISWVYACVDAISDDVAQTEVYLKKLNNNGEVEIIKSHPILDFIYKANDVFTKFDLLKLTQAHLELTGEAPWYITKTESGKPTKILLLESHNLTVVPAFNEDKNEDMVSHYLYRVSDGNSFKEIRIEKDELVFLRNPNPSDQFRGRGTVEAILSTHELDILSEQFNKDFFKNSAQPSLILSTDKAPTASIIEKLQKNIRDKYEGYRNQHKTLILTNGLKVEKSTSTHNEMQYAQQQEFSRDKILASFRVPPSILGLTKDVNRANAEAGEYVFGKRVILPKLKRVFEQLSEFLIPMFGLDATYFLDFDDPVPKNKELNLNIANQAFTAGLITKNEAREVIGFDPLETEGDSFANESVSVNNTASYYKAKRALHNNKKQTTVNKIVNEVLKTKVRELVQPIVMKSFTKKQKNQWKEKAKELSSVKNYTEKDWLGFQAQQHTVMDKYYPILNKKMKSLFNKQKKIVLDSLDMMGDNVSINKLLLNVDKQQDEYVDKFLPTYGSLIVEQAQLALRLLGKENKIFKFTNKEKLTRYTDIVRAYVIARALRIGEETIITTNNKLADIINESLVEGLSIVKIRNKITDLFKEMSDYRAERIARTETTHATNFATEQAYIESEVVEKKEWLTAIDERTCPHCMAMNRKTISLGKSWYKKGDAMIGIDGSRLEFSYEDIDHPPLHTNCRCTLIPVL